MNIFKERTIIFVFCLSIFPCFTYAQSLINVLKSNQQTTSFARALEQSGLDQRLSGNGPFTVFAPTNGAFDQAAGGINVSSGRMRSLLLNHVMTGMATGRSIRIMTKATSLGGITLTIETGGGDIRINNARLIQTNIRADNGVVHVIDGVLR